MRTTIEMSDRHREALLGMAARRGKKGFSGIVAEAIDAYLRSSEGDTARRRAALALRGRLSPGDGAEIERTARAIRTSWR